MSLRNRMLELKNVEDVDQFLKSHPTGAFFKAGSCHKTMQGFGYVEEALNPRETMHLAYVKVVEYRPVSNYIAQLTGVVHQSPQLILLINGKVVYDVDNWNITPEALKNAFDRHLGPVKELHSAKKISADPESIQAYRDQLSAFITGQLDEKQFSKQWLLTFRNDAALRSTEEFALLNSLFGDVDSVLAKNDSHYPNAHLLERAKALLQKLGQ